MLDLVVLCLIIWGWVGRGGTGNRMGEAVCWSLDRQKNV